MPTRHFFFVFLRQSCALTKEVSALFKEVVVLQHIQQECLHTQTCTHNTHKRIYHVILCMVRSRCIFHCPMKLTQYTARSKWLHCCSCLSTLIQRHCKHVPPALALYPPALTSSVREPVQVSPAMAIFKNVSLMDNPSKSATALTGCMQWLKFMCAQMWKEATMRKAKYKMPCSKHGFSSGCTT